MPKWASRRTAAEEESIEEGAIMAGHTLKSVEEVKRGPKLVSFPQMFR